MLIFGMGYVGSRLAVSLAAEGWQVVGVGRVGDGNILGIESDSEVRTAVASATHIVSTVPPHEGTDPVLERYAEVLRAKAGWIGYLSSTGVYGDTNGAWVDESAGIGAGRRTARAAADLAWQELSAAVRVFRLPGIYGPGRSPLDRVREGRAHRIAVEGQVFSRIHVDDIISATRASFDGPAGAYNISDDRPSSQNVVIEHACALLGIDPPPLQSLEEAALGPMARGFYAENRRISNRKAKRLLDWVPQYCDYKQGLAAILKRELAGSD